MPSQKQIAHKKRAIRISRFRLFAVSVLFVVLLSIFLCNTFGDVVEIFSDKKTSQESDEILEGLLEEEASLQSEVTKLQDVEYIARYAREKYSFSKDEGEIILRIPNMETKGEK